MLPAPNVPAWLDAMLPFRRTALEVRGYRMHVMEEQEEQAGKPPGRWDGRRSPCSTSAPMSRTSCASTPCARPAPASSPRRNPATSTRRGVTRPLCRRCAHVITDASLRLEVDGRATHARLNPAGILFVFDCYQDAPGCLVHGAPTLEASWFTACAWRFANCAHCAAHLGWAFSGASSFFGLISERVVTE